MEIDRPSPNHGPRPPGTSIDLLVLHYTGMRTGSDALARLCDEAAQVSAHYLVEEDGTIFCLVPEERRAWHAGVSSWRGRPGVNDTSIGIEIVNPGHEFGYRPFPQPQIDAVIGLCRGILSRHPIPARNVVGHSDVAPTRKTDPGELFPWHQLAAAGVGLWPQGLSTPKVPAEALLSRFGYDCTDLPAAVAAFQRHFRQGKVDGVMDAETHAFLQEITELAEAAGT